MSDTEEAPQPWIDDPDLGDGPTDVLDPKENTFWIDLIKKYLYPLENDSEHKKAVKRDLKDL